MITNMSPNGPKAKLRSEDEWLALEQTTLRRETKALQAITQRHQARLKQISTRRKAIATMLAQKSPKLVVVDA